MSVRICSKTLLSLLLVIMDDNDMTYLQLQADEASRLVELLCIATKEGESSEGLLTFTVVELLVSFVNLSSLAKNKVVIIEAGIVDYLPLLILNKDYKVQEQSLRLLWTLLSGSQLSTRIMINHGDLCLMLQFICESPSINLSLIAQCVLKTIYWDTPEGREVYIASNFLLGCNNIDCYNIMSDRYILSDNSLQPFQLSLISFLTVMCI